MSTASSVQKVYKTVVDDVINGVKEAFLDEGVDEQVLTELRQLWEGKLQSSKALEQPQEVDGTVFTNPAIAVLHQHQQGASRVMPASQMQQQTMPMNIQMQPGHEMTAAGATAAMALPGTLFQQHLSALNSGGIRLHHSGNGQFYALPINQGGQVTTTISLPQQTVAASQAQMVQASQPGARQPLPNMIQQIDGAGDTSSSEDEDFDNEDNDAESDVEEKEEEEQGAEEEPLNSDDDVTDDDPAEIFDTDNVIVCQYDKINRNKNKWKFHLKDGIMNLKGRDYVFQRATGDAEW